MSAPPELDPQAAPTQTQLKFATRLAGAWAKPIQPKSKLSQEASAGNPAAEQSRRH